VKPAGHAQAVSIWGGATTRRSLPSFNRLEPDERSGDVPRVDAGEAALLERKRRVRRGSQANAFVAAGGQSGGWLLSTRRSRKQASRGVAP